MQLFVFIVHSLQHFVEVLVLDLGGCHLVVNVEKLVGELIVLLAHLVH